MTALLPPGARVLAVAPSHAYTPAKLTAGIVIAAQHGVSITIQPDSLRPHRYFAGSDDHRLSQLTHALSTPDYDAVWLIRGGSGLTRLLPRIPWDGLPDKPVIGFSDATPLLEALRRRGHTKAVHGPVLHSLGSTDPSSIAQLFTLLGTGESAPLAGTTWTAGAATGPLVGGNVCMLAAVAGTPFQLDASGAIVVLEEIGEQPYRLDRALIQCRDAGSFDGAVGFALGSFTGCHPPSDAQWTLADMLHEVLDPLGLPIVADLPIGHGALNHAWVVGSRATLRDGELRLGPALA